MELAKITSKGQITLPINIRRALKLNDGDKVAFVEANGQFILANPSMLALRQAQDKSQKERTRTLYQYPGFLVAEKPGFEPGRRLSHPTPLAGEPLRPLGYFSV